MRRAEPLGRAMAGSRWPVRAAPHARAVPQPRRQPPQPPYPEGRRGQSSTSGAQRVDSSPDAHRPLYSSQLLTFVIFDAAVSVVLRRPRAARQRQKNRRGTGGKAPSLTTETRRLSASEVRSGHERPAGQASRLTGLRVLLHTLPASHIRMPRLAQKPSAPGQRVDGARAGWQALAIAPAPGRRHRSPHKAVREGAGGRRA